MFIANELSAMMEEAQFEEKRDFDLIKSLSNIKIVLRSYSVLEKIKNWIDSIAESLKTLKIQSEPFISKRVFSMF